MSLDKAIKAGNEHRKQYRDSRSFDSSCRNHGRCPACRGNRMHKYEKAKLKAEDERVD
jgi:hypothetical protein